jgi:hypothetical protein
MSIKISDRFMKEVARAAEKLSEEHPVIALDGVFANFSVCLEEPEENHTSFYFRELGVDREGVLYLVAKDLLR